MSKHQQQPALQFAKPLLLKLNNLGFTKVIKIKRSFDYISPFLAHISDSLKMC
jgi:hypothetical protein